jgi:AcrR family transcriptional regulator
MTATARVPRPRREEVRSRLLAAAATVFAQRGFSGATIDEIAALAGFTKGAVYSNFASKDELFLALLDTRVDALIQEILSEVPVDQSHALTVGNRLTEVAIDQPEWRLLFVEFWLRACREPAVREQFVAHRRALHASIAEATRRAFPGEEGSLPWSAEEVSILVLALSNGLGIERLIDPAHVPSDLFGRALQRLAGE